MGAWTIPVFSTRKSTFPAPFLRTVIAALVDGRLVDGFEARSDPAASREATLYLPTRRAGRMAREIFLDVLKADAAVLPRIVALGDIDEDELAFAEERRAAWRRGAAGYSAEARRTRAPADAGAAGRGLGQGRRCWRRWWSAARPRRWRWPAIWRA